MPYYWNPASGRYHDSITGRFVPRSLVLEWLDKSITASQDIIRQMAAEVYSGEMTPAAFERLMRQEIKSEFIRQYLAGIGGRGNMTPADWGRIGNMLRDQYAFLANFVQEITAGLSEGQILMRSAMYGNAAREANERARGLRASQWGADEVQWTLGFVKTHHCDDCLTWSRLSWQPIGKNGGFMSPKGEAFPGNGISQCLTNCHCSLDFRRSVDGKDWRG